MTVQICVLTHPPYPSGCTHIRCTYVYGVLTYKPSEVTLFWVYLIASTSDFRSPCHLLIISFLYFWSSFSEHYLTSSSLMWEENIREEKYSTDITIISKERRKKSESYMYWTPINWNVKTYINRTLISLDGHPWLSWNLVKDNQHTLYRVRRSTSIQNCILI